MINVSIHQFNDVKAIKCDGFIALDITIGENNFVSVYLKTVKQLNKLKAAIDGIDSALLPEDSDDAQH